MKKKIVIDATNLKPEDGRLEWVRSDDMVVRQWKLILYLVIAFITGLYTGAVIF